MNALGSALVMHGGLHYECMGVCIGNAGGSALVLNVCKGICIGSVSVLALRHSGGNTMILWSWAHEISGGSYDLMIMGSWDLGGFLGLYLGEIPWSYDHGLMRSGVVLMILWSWAHEIWGGFWMYEIKHCECKIENIVNVWMYTLLHCECKIENIVNVWMHWGLHW